jgi:transposase
MNLHRNARLTPRGRWLLVERVCRQRVPLKHAAEAAGISTRTASKWVARYRREGAAGLEDRSSAPHRVPSRTSEERVLAIATLRRLRMTAAEISELLGMPISTVSVVLGRIGLGKRSRLEPLEPANRYQRQRSSTSTSRNSDVSNASGTASPATKPASTPAITGATPA